MRPSFAPAVDLVTDFWNKYSSTSIRNRYCSDSWWQQPCRSRHGWMTSASQHRSATEPRPAKKYLCRSICHAHWYWQKQAPIFLKLGLDFITGLQLSCVWCLYIPFRRGYNCWLRWQRGVQLSKPKSPQSWWRWLQKLTDAPLWRNGRKNRFINKATFVIKCLRTFITKVYFVMISVHLFYNNCRKTLCDKIWMASVAERTDVMITSNVYLFDIVDQEFSHVQHQKV